MGPRIHTTVIDDTMRERWWQLSLAGIAVKSIAIRFGIHRNYVGRYLKVRREREGVTASRDTVTMPELAGKFLADVGKRPRAVRRS